MRIEGTGFCHTDVLPRTPGFMASPPIIAGHEGGGVVTAVGEGVDVAVGAHVLLSFDSCGHCTNCVHGHPAYCRSFFTRNLTGRAVDGSTPVVDRHGQPVAARWFAQSSFSSHCLAGPRNVVVVDDDLPLHLFAPLGCGIQTGAGSVLNALRVQAGTSFVVFGAGSVGLAAVMAARVAGAVRIVAVDLHTARLELALELGATHVVRGGTSGVARQVRSITKGGAQYALDTTGQPTVIADGVDSLRPTGTIGLVGSATQDLVLGAAALTSGKNVMGILEGDAVPQVLLPQLIDLWRQGRFPFDRLVSTYPLSDINAAEHDAAAGVVIKPVLVPAA